MTNPTENGQTGTSGEPIRPAEILLNRTVAPESIRSTAANTGTRFIWITLSVLVAMAAAVIFVLPRYISPPAQVAESPAPAQAPAGNAAHTAPNTAAKPVEAAPWQAAQLARQRENSQEVLSRMLELQEQLEQKNVSAWGAAEYERALQLARDGDAAYQQQEFERSLELYNGAAAAMTGLLDNMETLFGQSMAEGNAAIVNGNAATAERAFQRALIIKPDAEPALAGLRRSKTLNQVLQLITEGNDLQQNGELEPAKSRYEQALALDKQMDVAKQQLAAVNAKINEVEFTRLMSTGYTHLQNDDLTAAKSAFEKAGRLKPGTAEVKSALAQIQGRITNDQINTLLQSAVALEKQEKWKEAAAEYDRALALDANLAQAQEGRQYSDSRAQLDERLEQIIAKPDRLSDQAAHADALALYQQAISITPAEPRLTAQLQKVDRLLAVSTIPVAVRLRSDNLTDIIVLRVGPQGKLTEKSLMLLPGSYTVIGTREGYRDVRVEFRVTADAPAQTVEVSATEKIAAR